MYMYEMYVSDRVQYRRSTRDNSSWWTSRIAGTQSIGEEHHVIHMIVQQMHILTLAITNIHSQTQTHIHSMCGSNGLCWCHSNWHDIPSNPLPQYVHFPYKVLFLSFPQYLQPLYGGFYTQKSKSNHCSNKSKVSPFSHAVVSTEIPFCTIKALQLYSLSIVMCFRFIIDIRPSRDCFECCDPI